MSIPISVSKYSRKTTHSLTYYKSVILILLEGLHKNLTHQAIADRLNGEQILTPTGLIWTATIVKETLKKLRLHHEYPNKLHHAVLELIYVGQLTVKQTLILFQQRQTGSM
jgi:hypothetical protein